MRAAKLLSVLLGGLATLALCAIFYVRSLPTHLIDPAWIDQAQGVPVMKTIEGMRKTFADKPHEGAPVFYVSRGTPCWIISHGLRTEHVKIGAGDHKGMDGWVPTDYLEEK